MNPFPLAELLAPSAFVLIGGLTFCYLVTRSVRWSVCVALVKTAAFISYFGTLFDGGITFKDDWVYLSVGATLVEEGVSIVNFAAHLPQLFTVAGGKHFIYYLYNADSIRLFGEAYYAPVALNVVMTVLAAAFTAAAAKAGLGLSRRLGVGLFVFTAIHPDVVVWSTVMNSKDLLVLTGTSLSLYVVSIAGQRRLGSAVALGLFAGAVLFFTRYYVPLMLIIAVIAAAACAPWARRSIGLWAFAALGAASLVTAIGVDGFTYALARLEEDFVNPLYGVPRMVLTPIPFHTDAQYVFLDLPQVFHWLMSPILVYGAIRVWRVRTVTARFAVIYFALMIILYGFFGELQGPRHRVQLDGIIALFQFYGGLGILKQLRPLGHARPASRPFAQLPHT